MLFRVSPGIVNTYKELSLACIGPWPGDTQVAGWLPPCGVVMSDIFVDMDMGELRSSLPPVPWVVRPMGSPVVSTLMVGSFNKCLSLATITCILHFSNRCKYY